MKILIAVLWVCLTLVLTYLPAQDNFPTIALGYTGLFGLYLVSYRVFRKHSDVLLLIFLGVFLRALTLFAFPNLSDDIYRFLWDGHLINDGINPFLFTPTEWMGRDPGAGIYSELYPKLNSPEYYSVYPPVCQILFAAATKLFPLSAYWASVFLKLVFLTAEVGTVYILMKFVQQVGLPLKRVLLYALNPLIIIELMGNLHFECIMIFFLVAALWFYARKRFWIFGLLFGLSILTKLLPLMFLPFFIRRTPFKKLIISFSIIAAVISLGFLPFINQAVIGKFGSSLDLYFRKFEFNASFYYLAREFGFAWKGFNMIATIGPRLSVLTLIIIIGLMLRENKMSITSLTKNCLLAFTTYLLLTTTVHPWYLATPIVLCIFTHFRYPLFWSGLITLTYINYWGGDYHERMGVVVIEYAIVMTILYLEAFRVPLVKKMALNFLRFFRTIGVKN